KATDFEVIVVKVGDESSRCEIIFEAEVSCLAFGSDNFTGAFFLIPENIRKGFCNGSDLLIALQSLTRICLSRICFKRSTPNLFTSNHFAHDVVGWIAPRYGHLTEFADVRFETDNQTLVGD